MSLLSSKASAELEKLSPMRHLGSVKRILDGNLPPKKWWDIVSKAGHTVKADRVDFAAAHELENENVAYRGNFKEGGAPWPPSLYETEHTLLGISGDEALAIWDAYLRAEGASQKEGYVLYRFHWNLLAVHFCPLRERYTCLIELIEQGSLKQVSGGNSEKASGITWPVAITEKGLQQLDGLKWSYRLPPLRRLEKSFRSLKETFPHTLSLLLTYIIGIGSGQLIPFGELIRGLRNFVSNLFH